MDTEPNNNTSAILVKKNDYSITGVYTKMCFLSLQRDCEVIYSNDDIHILKDKERKDIFIYHSLKDYGVQIKYTSPVTIYKKGSTVLYANEYDEPLKIGAYIKNIDNFTHLVSNGEKEIEVSFVMLCKGNCKYLGKKLSMSIMKEKYRTEDESVIIGS